MKSDRKRKIVRARKHIDVLHEEIRELSKKKPDDPLNKFKLSLVNELLGVANDLLPPEERPFSSFVNFDEVNLPTNSDVVVVLSQYQSALAQAEQRLKYGDLE